MNPALRRFGKRMLIAFAVLAVGVPPIVGRIISTRIRHTLEERFGSDYAILAAHVDRRPALSFNMYRKTCSLIWRALFPPVPQGSMGRTGTPHHLVYLISDNRAVCLYTWSFRAFRLQPHLGSDQIADMPEEVRSLYRFSDDEVRIIDGLRVKNVKEPEGVRFYYHGI